MKKRVVFASKNAGKIREVKNILSGESVNGEGNGLDIEILSMSDAGIDIDVVEDGATFADNAVKKAVEICKAANCMVLSDDSGLEIDYLDKAPGVYSARYLGEDTPYPIKMRHILDLMKDVPQSERTARFVCVIAAAIPNPSDDGDGIEVLCEYGVMEGLIGTEIKGESGFGYDPIFYVPEFGLTSAEMTPEQKNAVSHRGKALQNMKKKLGNKLI